jgi:hypothetical protein
MWDILNEELMRLEFHDLEGINEKEGVLFCRTHNEINPHAYNSPLRYDPNSINTSASWVSLDPENKASVPFLEKGVTAQQMVLNLFGTANYRKLDVLNSNLGEVIFKT